LAADNIDYTWVVSSHRPPLAAYESIYRQIHANPELSGQESQTAHLAATHLRSLSDFTVHANVGGHGVVGLLRNGPGPTVLLRADMDALPMLEKTELPYASTKRMIDTADGVEKPVMHGCGHDVHVACLMAASTLLHSARRHWSGTLIIVFQPSEERAGGAQGMVDSGLYRNLVPKPDYVLAQHVSPMPAGTVGVVSGPCLAGADTLNIRIKGRGGHGSAPQRCIDPVVLGCGIVTKLQTIVSREVAPDETAVVTCGSIRAGEAPNIIPDYLDFSISIRTFKPSVREKILAAVKRIVTNECKAATDGVAGEDEDLTPVITHNDPNPPTINSPELASSLSTAFADYFGAQRCVPVTAQMASEDVSVFATAVDAQLCMWVLGGTDLKKWKDAERRGRLEEIPGNHSSDFGPVIQPTILTGTDALAVAALRVFDSST
jgi:amidohydrolase